MAAAELSAATAIATAEANTVTAVKALLKWKESQSATQKPQLLPQDDFIYLNLTLEKIPQNTRTKPFKILLPHPLFNSSSELCLIIDDRPNSNLTKESAQKIIKSQNIAISKIIKLSKLMTDYKSFEARRKLCGSYDLFLVDRRIVHFLPRLLGSSFFKKKKLPLSLDLGHKNWKEQIERVTGSALLYIRTGTCCVMKVAKVSMESEEIVENVVAAIKGAVDLVPKKWRGIRSLQLKFSDSLALPVYQALPEVKFKIEVAKENVGLSNLEVEMKDGSQVEEKKKEKKEKKEKKKKKKGRIHEVRYMDVAAGEAELESKGSKNEVDELVGGNEEGHDEIDVSKSEDDDDLDNGESTPGKGKKVNLKENESVDGKLKKKKAKSGEKEGKKKRLRSEAAEESIEKKETRKNKTGKGLKEASAAKKSKRGKTRL